MNREKISSYALHLFIPTASFCVASCLMDFDKFRSNGDSEGTTSSTSSGMGGSGGQGSSTTASTSSSGGNTTSSSSNGGAGGSTTSSSESSSSAGGGGASSSTSSTTSSTNSSSSSSSSSSTGSGGGCAGNEHDCGGSCELNSDPAFGCGAANCTPCAAVDNGSSDCTGSACSIGSCDPGYDDCNTSVSDGCEVDLLSDLNHCGDCSNPCTGLGEVCDTGVCASPCGAVPATGWYVCWVYPHPGSPTQLVGLAGGIAVSPDTIMTKFSDPMNGASGTCVSPMASQDYVLCDLGTPPSNADIQLRAGLHTTQAAGTTAGTFDCGTTTCTHNAYVYHNGVEAGAMVGGVTTGVVSLIPHYSPPNLLNLKVAIP